MKMMNKIWIRVNNSYKVVEKIAQAYLVEAYERVIKNDP